MVATKTSIWALLRGAIAELDPGTDKVTRSIPIGGSPTFLALAFGSLWVTDYDAGLVTRISPKTGKTLATVGLPTSEGMAASPAGLWVAEHHEGAVSLIDPMTDRVTATISVGPKGSNGPQGLAAVGDRIWVGVPNEHALVAIDPATRSVATTVHGVVDPCGDITSVTGNLWVSECGDERFVDQIDPSTGRSLGHDYVAGFVGTPLPATDGVWLPVRTDSAPEARGTGRLLKLSTTGSSTDAVGLPAGCQPGPAIAAFGSAWIACGHSLVRLAASALP